MSKATLFSTEGTIESIEFDVNTSGVCFWLVPASTSLVDTPSGKQALFRGTQEGSATLVGCQKTPGGKEGVEFSFILACCITAETKTCVRDCMAGLLLSAKNARESVRVWVAGSVNDQGIVDLDRKHQFVVSKVTFL